MNKAEYLKKQNKRWSRHGQNLTKFKSLMKLGTTVGKKYVFLAVSTWILDKGGNLSSPLKISSLRCTPQDRIKWL